MKIFALSLMIVSSLGTAASVHAATAYDALRTVQKTRGQSVMNQLVEVRGESGTSQPQAWVVLMNDSSARGGIREFTIASDEIRSERTPLRRFGVDVPSGTLNFSKLNLDSDGAFKVAEREAIRMKVAFHSVDYLLRTDSKIEAPVWSLRLFDHMGAPVGNLRISAVDGKIIQPLRLDADARVISESERPTKARPPATPKPTPDTTSGRKPLGGALGFASQTIERVKDKTVDISKTVANKTVDVSRTVADKTVDVSRTVADKTVDVSKTVAGSVEEFLTGERTIGRDNPRALPTPTPTPAP